MPILRRTALAISAGFLALITACSSADTMTAANVEVTSWETTATATAAVDAVAGQTVEEALAANLASVATPTEWDASAEVSIKLTGDSAEAESDAVVVDGSTVTLTASGIYRLSGTLTDGQVVVDAADDNASAKGIRRDVSVVIGGGDIDLTTSDDGVNVAGGNEASGTGGRGGGVTSSRRRTTTS